ncbi:hypothetical protein F5146DRAFT_997614 [Armillaria mellea]|nr:hypothetical protein F5146DRAFT_997614 [Armillaria mellea]
MASADTINQLASHLTAKPLRDSNMIDLPTEVEVLFTAVKQTTSLPAFMRSIEEVVPETTCERRKWTKGKQTAKETATELEVRSESFLMGSSPRAQRWEKACKLLRDEMDRPTFKLQAQWWKSKAEQSMEGTAGICSLSSRTTEHMRNYCAVSWSYVDRWIELAKYRPMNRKRGRRGHKPHRSFL